MDSMDCIGRRSILFEDDSLDAKNLLDFDDFPLGEEEEQKEDYFPGAEEGSDDGADTAWVQLLNLPPAAGVPVGGMRRVSSCYFSIASNLSAGDYHSTNAMLENSSFYSPHPSNPSDHNSMHHCDALSFEGRDASDFLLHDLLMHIFTFLDAQSLASFSETARRPNFECFYFLELQLQRALLVGDSHGIEWDDEEDELGGGGDGDDAHASDADREDVGGIEISDANGDALLAQPFQQVDDESSKGNIGRRISSIPSFEGSIAGTGVISRLAFLDPTSARRIIQSYLDSNASIRSMPLLHSLAYLRQVLMRGAPNPSLPIPHPTAPNIPEHVAKNARNMALIFTFLGAAYVHTQQGGTPDPSEMLNEDNIEALKNVMLKLGLAKGFFEAGKRMKEKVVEQAAVASESAGSDCEEARAQVAWSSSQDNSDASTNDDAVSPTNNADAAPNTSALPTPHPMTPIIPEGVAKNARNMALIFTFLGAAYVHTSMPSMPDPNEMLNEENVDVLKNMMLKLGLVKGFFEAGKRMKEKVAEQVEAAGKGAGSDSDVVGAHVTGPSSQGNDDVANGDPSSTKNDDIVSFTNKAEAPTNHRKSNPRSSSVGSLEDLSHMMPRTSAIASRLYNAFSSNRSNNINSTKTTATFSPKTLAADLGANGEEENESTGDHQKLDCLPEKEHRSKRSHKPLREGMDDAIDEFTVGKLGGNDDARELCDRGISSNEVESLNRGEPIEEQKADHPLFPPEEIAHAMDNPPSDNPYAHELSKALNNASTTASAAVVGSKTLSNGDDLVAQAEDTSFFSFDLKSQETAAMTAGNKPTGCVGAYTRAVRAAASEVTRLVKAERRRNYDSLSADLQHELSVRFIEACTSDDTLHTVKEILQKNKEMDVDRFFVGPDDTETCALHAAAFNGAERVLEFLCGGIDERNPREDCGLCDVNVRDANGWTALHFAAGANSVTSVRVLSEHGAKLAVEAGNGYTPYHWAERLSNEEAKAELGKLGADSRFVGGWMFGGAGRGFLDSAGGSDSRRIPFVSFLANQFFAFSGR